MEMKLLEKIKYRFKIWIKKIKRDRAQVDKKIKTHENMKDEQRHTPEGVAATVSEEKKYRI
ncbi:MAG: hypothetical protein JW776_13355 [Candidatus Lokiarchaeota archaeon]|nr:hypothetical protein [Candidatus Lokiarchaeota archaeon]